MILGHWGEVVLFYLERLKSLARVAKLERPVEDYFKQNLYVTPSGMWSQDYLERAVTAVGPERILFRATTPINIGRAGRDVPSWSNPACLYSIRNSSLMATGNASCNQSLAEGKRSTVALRQERNYSRVFYLRIRPSPGSPA